MLTAHRQTANRTRELRERAWTLAEQRLGRHVLCSRCGATYSTFADKCLALDDGCPGAAAISAAKKVADKDVGLLA